MTALSTVASSNAATCIVVFAPDCYIPVADRRQNSQIHLSVDQIRVINLSESPPDEDHPTLIIRSLNTTSHGTDNEQAIGNFTQCKLIPLSNWKEWQANEFKQLDSMAEQEMYGMLGPSPPGAIVLRQHWNYSFKVDGMRKARNCYDGSPHAAPQLKFANSYSSCIEQPCLRLFFALCAHKGFISLKVDATNANANLPPPDQPTCVSSTTDTQIGTSPVLVSRSVVIWSFPFNMHCKDIPNQGHNGNIS